MAACDISTAPTRAPCHTRHFRTTRTTGYPPRISLIETRSRLHWSAKAESCFITARLCTPRPATSPIAGDAATEVIGSQKVSAANKRPKICRTGISTCSMLPISTTISIQNLSGSAIHDRPNSHRPVGTLPDTTNTMWDTNQGTRFILALRAMPGSE